MPVEPPPTRWLLPSADAADETEIAGVGADLAPGTLLAAYRAGLFPMRVGRGGPIGWWSPDPRGIIPLDHLHESRSLRRSRRRFPVALDTAFEAVMRGCGDPRRPHGWIDEEFVSAYCELHRLGWAHSVEAYDERGVLVGGVYGIGIGGLFAAESMFHRATDAGKVALAALVELLRAGGALLLDVQWTTEHLASLGAVDVPRAKYLELLAEAMTVEGPEW
jgi:leucyl/phenylalanyl-tRNA--protein transferase